MGTTAFVVVWLPLGVTLLTAGLVSLRQARAIRRSRNSICFERYPSSPVTADRTLSALPFGDAEAGDPDAREYRLLGMAMLAGSCASLAVGAIQLL